MNNLLDSVTFPFYKLHALGNDIYTPMVHCLPLKERLQIGHQGNINWYRVLLVQ